MKWILRKFLIEDSVTNSFVLDNLKLFNVCCVEKICWCFCLWVWGRVLCISFLCYCCLGLLLLFCFCSRLWRIKWIFYFRCFSVEFCEVIWIGGICGRCLFVCVWENLKCYLYFLKDCWMNILWMICRMYSAAFYWRVSMKRIVWVNGCIIFDWYIIDWVVFWMIEFKCRLCLCLLWWWWRKLKCYWLSSWVFLAKALCEMFEWEII